MSINFEKPVANFVFSLGDLSSRQKTFYENWKKIKGDRLMPKRSDFEPMKFPRVVPFLSLEDVSYAPLRFQVRLVGGSTASARNSKGQFLDEISGTAEIINMLTQMVERKEPYHYVSNVNWDARNYKTYSSLIVPFSEDGERVTLSMACHHTLSISKYSHD